MALNKAKTDPELGKAVHEHLVKMGVETPGVGTPVVGSGTTSEEKVEKIRKNFEEILLTLGLDLTDDSLMDTPRRVAKMYVNEIFWGLDPENFPKCTAVDNKMKYDEMVIEKSISVNSNCEHHLVIIDGIATVAYIPKEKVLGLSKLNRIVEYFSKRPQIQERLTEQVYHALSYILDTDDVAVMVNATHYCVRSRGVEDENSHTVTSKLGGVFKKDNAVRSEFIRIALAKD